MRRSVQFAKSLLRQGRWPSSFLASMYSTRTAFAMAWNSTTLVQFAGMSSQRVIMTMSSERVIGMKRQRRLWRWRLQVLVVRVGHLRDLRSRMPMGNDQTRWSRGLGYRYLAIQGIKVSS
ncbi:hypothetical protein MA16_Dca005533 [Dendrobium catenatum]|uniref:Uncharacterized protein n=1 Tax=Dendrobium catenatum TaxID=906689 RepID=A0A2I0WPY7_9ASPA|nr:hypothetical protein MA16_Dca005533 [Dendrobium catenatum]